MLPFLLLCIGGDVIQDAPDLVDESLCLTSHHHYMVSLVTFLAGSNHLRRLLRLFLQYA